MNTVLLTKNFQNGLDKTLSLVYNVVRTDNLYNGIEEHRPFCVFASVEDMNVLDVLDEYPFIKCVFENKGEPFAGDIFQVERFYGLDPFIKIESVNRTFDIVTVCNKTEYNDKFLSPLINDIIFFGEGWPNAYGICDPPSIYNKSDKVIYGGKFPSDDLINALFFSGKVYGKIDFPDVLPVEDVFGRFEKASQKLVWDKYNYGVVADKLCDYLGLPEKTFSTKVEKIRRKSCQ